MKLRIPHTHFCCSLLVCLSACCLFVSSHPISLQIGMSLRALSPAGRLAKRARTNFDCRLGATSGFSSLRPACLVSPLPPPPLLLLSTGYSPLPHPLRLPYLVQHILAHSTPFYVYLLQKTGCALSAPAKWVVARFGAVVVVAVGVESRAGPLS